MKKGSSSTEFRTPLKVKEITFDENNKLLHSGDIYKSIVCLRPTIKSPSPKLHYDEIGDRIVFHNYGHGGIGWTINWGCIKHTLNLLQNKLPNLEKSSKISVVGAGIIGLGTALFLIENGFNNIEIIANDFTNTTSHNSGAYFGFFNPSKGNVSHEYIDLLVESYKTWKEIYEGQKFGISKGILWINLYCINENSETGRRVTQSGLEHLIEKGYFPPDEEIILDFKSVSHKVRKNKTFYFNTIELLDEITDILKSKGVKFIQHKLINFDDQILSKVVFNCTGLSSTELNSDKELYPTAGHLLYLKNQNIKESNYLLFCDFAAPSFAQYPIVFYYMPKSFDTCTGIIGGTYISNYTGDDEKKNQYLFKAILKASSEIFGFELNEVDVTPKAKF